MKATVLLIALAVLTSSCASLRSSIDDEDLWFGPDKPRHFAVSGAVAFGSTLAARSLGAPTTNAAVGGFTFTITGGALKELWDATASDGSGWSWRDLTWDLLGDVAGTWAGVTVPIPAGR